MARVLFAWDQGGDPAHERRITGVARALRAMGHEAAFAFRDLAFAARARAEGVAWFQAPWLVPPSRPEPAPLNHADFLLNTGYADPIGLAQALRAWVSIFRLWRADVVVVDSAPAALLAARIAGLRRVTLGSGFSVPPAGSPLPPFRPWIANDAAELRARDALLGSAIREAFSRAEPRAQPPTQAADVFSADANLVCAWPELDPFGPREGVEYLGPQAEGGHGLEWIGSARPRIVAHLQPDDARFPNLVRALCQVAGEAVIMAPGATPEATAACEAENARVLPEASDPSSLLAGADLAVCHGGEELATRALAAGVPLATVPRHLEHYLVALRMKELGAAAVSSPLEPPPDFGPWFAEAAASRALRDGALAVSPRFGRPTVSAAARIVALLDS